MKVSMNKSGATRREDAKSPVHDSVTVIAKSTSVEKNAKQSRPHTGSSTAQKTSNILTNSKKARKIGSKHDRVVASLQRPQGATIKELIKITGWQPHSIRGFLAGTVRKKLKLPLRSELIEGVRKYRVGTKATPKAVNWKTI